MAGAYIGRIHTFLPCCVDIMKNFYVPLCMVFLIACSDDAPTTPNPIPSASRNIADYIYNGKVGTEYWIREKVSNTDTNNITTVKRTDTVAVRIINRNFNHPSFGSCIQTVDLYPHHGYFVRDTVYYRLKNDTIHVSYSSLSEPDPTLIEILRAPLQKGTKTKTAGDEAEITDMDVPVTTPAGVFSCVVVKAQKRQTISEDEEKESEDEYYIVEKALFARMVKKETTYFLKSGKKGITLKEYELIDIKNPQ